MIVITKKPKINAHITLDGELAGIKFKLGKFPTTFDSLTKEQQIQICNSFVDFYQLFSKFIKE